MILILSERSDVTTYHVRKWLEFYKKEVVTITDEDPIEKLCISNSEILFTVNGYLINLNEVEAYWYRRGFFILPFDIEGKDLPVEIYHDIKKEQSLVNEIIHTYLLKTPNLSTIFNSDLNRICNIQKAKEVGMRVPDFGIYNRKNDVETFFSNYSKIVTKPIWNGLTATEENRLFINHTSILDKQDVEMLPNVFAPSLFMEYVEKKYELRVFYLNGNCYTMAILSQNDLQTQVDFRKYNKEKPNRNLSYLLPFIIKQKIRKLMNKVRLKTGSIDIIVTPDNQFVFLEINPIGQFLNVSHTCNYNIEKEIALYLINIAK